MIREKVILGVSVVFIMMVLRGEGGFVLSLNFRILIGLFLFLTASYQFYIHSEFQKHKKYLTTAWIIIIGFSIVQFHSPANVRTISESDLIKAEGYKGIRDCEDGRRWAKKDVSRGELRLIFGSYGGRQQFATNLEKYDIDVVRLDGLLGIPNECYNQIMEKEIKDRFGSDFYSKVMSQ